MPRFTEAEWRKRQRRETLFEVGMVIAFFIFVAWGALELFERITSHGAHGFLS